MGKVYQDWNDAEIIRENIVNHRSANFYLRMAKETTRAIKFLNRAPGQIKFLDFGMGAGNWCVLAKAFGCDVYGAELSSEHISNAESIGVKTLGLDGVRGHKFDYINSEQVFEHLATHLPLRYLEK